MVSMSRLSNKVAIVTGASKGIGSGIATALGAAGARVAVNYSSDREGAERVAQAITDNGGDAIAVGADVSKAADAARLFKEVDSAFGRLDVLVNNAAVFRRKAGIPLVRRANGTGFCRYQIPNNVQELRFSGFPSAVEEEHTLKSSCDGEDPTDT